MPHLLWLGPGRVEETEHERSMTPELTEPTGVDMDFDKRKYLSCKVTGCGKRFVQSDIFARHFNSKHHELIVVKESYKDHMEEVWL